MADGMRGARRPAAFGLSLVAALSAMIAVAGVQLGGGGCSSERVELGTQCPAPDNPAATVERGMDAGPVLLYGTRCAPCDDPQPRLDARGCPIYVTFESCGGDICVGDLRFSPRAAHDDGGAGDETADAAPAAMEDAGVEP